MLGFLAKLIPQSSEQVVDNEISVESKMAFSALFGIGFTYFVKLPAAAGIVQLLGVTPASASGWGMIVAASVSAWLIAALHKHVYNGNAAPVVAASIVAAAPAALQQAQATSASVPVKVIPPTVAVTATQSASVPNPSAPAATPQLPAPVPASPTTPPASLASSQASQ